MNAHRNPDAVIDAFLADGAEELPDRTFDAVRADIHRTRQRVVIGPWREPDMRTPIRMAVAAAIVVFAIGITWNQFGPRQPGAGGPGSPAPASAPPATIEASAAGPGTLITGEKHQLEPGRYRIDYSHVPGTQSDGPSFTFDLTARGWSSVANYGLAQVYPEAISPGAALLFWNITGVYDDACTNHQPRATAPGPGLEDVLLAVATQPGLTAGPITDIVVDGYVGKHVSVEVTADLATCPDGYFTWGSDTEGQRAQVTGEVDDVYALDIAGQRVTFFIRGLPDSPATDIRQLERLVLAMDIQP